MASLSLVDKARMPAAARADGWSPSDQAWEQTQQRALEFYRAGEATAAARAWEQGLSIARRHFEPNDPRLATSLANLAYAARRQGLVQQARGLYGEALGVWDSCRSWILFMRPGRGDVLIHDREMQDELESFVARGREGTLVLLDLDQPIAEDGLALWKRTRPTDACDLRKLMAAVLLLVSHAEAPTAGPADTA
jgi:hypothetical protein